MGQNIIEYLREESIKDFWENDDIKYAWGKAWRKKILDIVGAQPSKNDILSLGDNLREIFKASSPKKISNENNIQTSNRGQKDLSKAGVCWEFLVCWYLNLCLKGTNTIAMKYKAEFIPSALNEALTVYYWDKNSEGRWDPKKTVKSASEIDLIAITFPDSVYEREVDSSPLTRTKAVKELNQFCEKDDNFSSLKVYVIQCKTNWNDISQIPLLWNIIYSSFRREGSSLEKSQICQKHRICVGTAEHPIGNLAIFKYAFVTAPSNQIETKTHKPKYGPDQVCVRRVKWLSGGNYWGCATQEGVALSLKEIFKNTFVDVKPKLDCELLNPTKANYLFPKALTYKNPVPRTNPNDNRYKEYLYKVYYDEASYNDDLSVGTYFVEVPTANS